MHLVEEGRAWKAFYLFVSFLPSLVCLLEERGLTFVICMPLSLSFYFPIKRCIQTTTFLKDLVEQFHKVVTTSSELINELQCDCIRVSLFISQQTVSVQAAAVLQFACTWADARAPYWFLVLLINPCLISGTATMKLIRAAILGKQGDVSHNVLMCKGCHACKTKLELCWRSIKHSSGAHRPSFK